MPEEVAVFVDFENLRYGLLNNFGQEPDIHAIVDKAKKYGRPSVMRAYADFSEHPSHLTRELQICGIEAINVPVKRTTFQKEGKPVNGGEIMYRQGGSRAEMWRLKSVPPVAFNQERPNLTEGGLDVQGGYLPPCSQGLFRRRDERPRGGPSVRATPGHGAQDARVLRAPRVSTATTGSQTEARSI